MSRKVPQRSNVGAWYDFFCEDGWREIRADSMGLLSIWRDLHDIYVEWKSVSIEN